MIYLFDLGGVIFHLDYNKTYHEFKRITGLSESQLFHQLKQPDFFDSFERGTISEEHFINFFKERYLPNDASSTNNSNFSEIISQAWNAMLLGIPEKNLSYIEKLSKTAPLYLLSNTNTLHWKKVINLLKNNNQLERFYACFSKIFLSFEIGLRKPEKEIYRYCLEKIACNESDIFFIDDNKDNINSANELGLKTFLYPPGNPLLNSVFNRI